MAPFRGGRDAGSLAASLSSPASPIPSQHSSARRSRPARRPQRACGTASTPSGCATRPSGSTAHRRPGRCWSFSAPRGLRPPRADAPSRSLDSLAGASALLFAGAGFATGAPDYLGLGGGPGPQAYLHAASEASASLDMLRAAHAFAARRHRSLATTTLVTGFSQGGHAAMALGRTLQDHADRRLRVGRSRSTTCPTGRRTSGTARGRPASRACSTAATTTSRSSSACRGRCRGCSRRRSAPGSAHPELGALRRAAARAGTRRG
jgi:hypothetical protein